MKNKVKMSFFLDKYIKRLLITTVLPLALASCNDDLVFDQGATSEDQIKISAWVDGTNNTRANMPYIDNGPVDKPGKLLLQYRYNEKSNEYKDGWADFGNTEGANIGYAYFMDGNTRKDLKWKHIYGEGTSTMKFYLSNLDPAVYSLQTTEHLWFDKKQNGKSTNPYIAGPLDEVNGTNDLLFASLNASRSSGELHFDLKHALSLLKIVVEVYGADDNHFINLDNAEVTISNLCNTVGSFRRTYPTTWEYSSSFPTLSNYYSTYKDRKTVNMVDLQDDSRSWDTVDKGIQVEDDEYKDYKKAVYTSKRFVFPPQTISTSASETPVLTVKVPTRDVTGNNNDEGFTTYSGYLPNAMFEVDEDGNIIKASGQTLSLKSGYQLTITAMINSPGKELLFTPVKIEAWVNKSEHYVNSYQGGIFNIEQFYTFVEDYKLAFEKGETWRLDKWGYKREDGIYVVQFWNNLKLDKAKIKDCLKGYIDSSGNQKPAFTFLLNGYTITLLDGTEDGELLAGAPGQAKLYEVVTGKVASYGIQNAAQMSEFMKAVDGQLLPDLIEVGKYALMDNFTQTCEIQITGSFEIGINDIFMKMMSQFWGYDVKMNITEGNQVTVVLPDNTTKIICKSGDEFDKLLKICSLQNTGIFSAGDFEFLVDCYNKYYKIYPDILKLYGKLDDNSQQWTIYLYRAFTIDGSKAYLSMVPDPDKGKPNYTVSGYYKITYEHDKIPCSGSSSSTHKYIWQGSGTATGTYSLRDYIIPYYNNDSYNNTNYFNFWDYGKWQNGKWIFNLSGNNQSCPYTTIFGSMVPDQNAGKYNYEFELGNKKCTVTSMPDSENSSTTKDREFLQNTAADLKKVAMGTYWK